MAPHPSWLEPVLAILVDFVQDLEEGSSLRPEPVNELIRMLEGANADQESVLAATLITQTVDVDYSGMCLRSETGAALKALVDKAKARFSAQPALPNNWGRFIVEQVGAAAWALPRLPAGASECASPVLALPLLAARADGLNGLSPGIAADVLGQGWRIDSRLVRQSLDHLVCGRRVLWSSTSGTPTTSEGWLVWLHGAGVLGASRRENPMSPGERETLRGDRLAESLNAWHGRPEVVKAVLDHPDGPAALHAAAAGATPSLASAFQELLLEHAMGNKHPEATGRSPRCRL